MLIAAALTMIIAAPQPVQPKARATASARAVIIEAARIDFATATVRVRKDQIRTIDFE